MEYIKKLGDMTREEFLEAGGKAANLSEMVRGGFNVPPGFCVTGRCYEYLVECNGGFPLINEIVEQMNFEDYGDIEMRTAQIRERIVAFPVPDDLRQEIHLAMLDLRGNGDGDPFVAVRSSVAVKGSSISSFPGMMDTYHFLRGEEQVVEYIQKCWASLWTGRAAFRRHQQGIEHSNGIIAAVVQKMVNADVAGVLFTANPITSSRDEIVVEAVFGLGEALVSGEGIADYYVVSKGTPPTIKEKRIGKKNIMVTIDREKGVGRKKYELTPEQSAAETLTDEWLLELGKLGMDIESVFGYPQDVEWAYENGELFVLQSRKVKGLRE